MKKSLKEEIDILEDMITSLVELLEERGIIKEGEWDKKVKTRINKKKELTKFEELQ